MARGRKTGGRKKGSQNREKVIRDQLYKAAPTVAPPAAPQSPPAIPKKSDFDPIINQEMIAKYFLGEAAREQKSKRPDRQYIVICLKAAQRTCEAIAGYRYPKLAQTTLRTDPQQPLTSRLEVEFVNSSKRDGKNPTS